MKRAVIYARVSSEQQAAEGLAVESQIHACRAKAIELGAAVVGVYRDDGISGTTDARPGFRAAVHVCATQAVDLFICWSSSRFARDQHDAIAYKRELASAGTRLVYASQQLDLTTHEGWLTDSFQQIMDENYSRQVSADTRRSMIKAAGDGYFMGGREPYGYRAAPAPDGRRRVLKPDPNESQIVRWMFQSAAEGAGAVALARQLNADGVTLRGRRWGKTTILNLLKSEVYMGNVIYNRFDRKTRRERPQAEWIRVRSHEPIIVPQAWQAAQAAIGARAPVTGQTPANTKHLFAGLMRCAACGGGMKMTTGTGRSATYHYYACNGAVQGSPCPAKPIRADKLDAWLLEQIVDLVLSPENVAAVTYQLDEAAIKWSKDRVRRRGAMVNELRSAENRRSKLYEVLETQGAQALGINDIAPRLRDLTEQITRLEQSLVALEDEIDPMVGVATVDPAEAAQIMRAMITGSEDVHALRGFLASLITHVTIDDKEAVVNYHPECLIRDARGVTVHSGKIWLPVLRLLRTTELRIPVPAGLVRRTGAGRLRAVLAA
jgi:site-specific DNA recombinase